jgi:hypothetical protein
VASSEVLIYKGTSTGANIDVLMDSDIHVFTRLNRVQLLLQKANQDFSQMALKTKSQKRSVCNLKATEGRFSK